MNIFLIHHRSKHHASNSGYGRLIDYVEGNVVYGQTKFPYRLAKLLSSFYTQKKGIFNTGSLLKLIELYRLLKQHKNQKNIVHFLNGERDIRHLEFFKRRFPNTKFCATFHKPPTILKQTIPNPSALQKLDGAIAVGTNQVEFLKEWLQLENVVYIPHGVDTDYFVPAISAKEQHTLLFVGQHLRDFDTFNKTIPKLAENSTDLKVNVVIHPAYSSNIEPHNCITILTAVKDKELRKLYQEAALLYLPMLDSTACNSILEALACGLPIVTSAVGGNAEYLKDTENMLVSDSNTQAYIEEITRLLINTRQLDEMGALSRIKALNYSWKHVAKKIELFYEKTQI